MSSRPAFFPILVLLTSFSMAQGPPMIVWQTSHGGSVDDQGHSIVQSTDGGYIVAGSVRSDDFDIVGHHGSVNSDDAMVLKYDADGNLIWQKSLGGTGQEFVFDMVATSNGGCVLAATASSTNGDVVGVTGGSDFWLVGLDANGAIIWQQVLGGSGSDYRLFMDSTTDGGLVLCGETQSTDGDVSSNHGVSDLWVVKLDDAGAIQWERSFGGSLAEYANGIVQNSSGGYYVAGATKSNDGDVSGNHGGVYDAWVIRLDGAGSLLWQRTMGGSDRDLFFNLSEDLTGGVICVGSTSSGDGDIPVLNGGGDLWVVDLDSTGNVQWNRTYGYTSNDGGRCIKRSWTGGYFVAGSTYGPNGYEAGLWLLELNGVGDEVWTKTIGGSTTSEGIHLIIDSNDDLVVTGWSASEDGDVTDNHGITDTWTVKLTLNYATLTGTAFLDENSNGAQDGAEAGLVNRPITNLGTGLSYFTDQDGGYRVTAVDLGTTTIAPQPTPYYSFAPATHTADFTALDQQVDALNDFAMRADGAFNDLAVALTPVGVFRHLWQTHYRIDYVNVGTTTIADPILRFAMDTGLTYHSATIDPTLINGDTLIWQLPEIAPYENGSINVFVSVPLSTPLGTTLVCTAFIDPVAGDADLANNSASWDVLAVGSADPNDILVDRAEVQFAELAPVPPYLEYLIRFQNTGTDTAFIVWIENAVPENADLSTFQFVSSSHPVQIDYLHHVDRFKFTYPDILLPDSTTNEAGSHGFIRYKIRPQSALMVGDSVLNVAGIYFDYNAPVITNTAHTVIDLTTGLSGTVDTGLMLSPNPNNGLFRIEAGTARSGIITIADATGRVLERIPYTGSRSLDLSKQVPGLYFVTLATTDVVVSGKVIIER